MRSRSREQRQRQRRLHTPAQKCSNRFFKKVQVKGVGDSEANAQTAYDNDLAKKIAAAKPDCDKLECEDSDTEACTFLHTQSKKANPHRQGPGFKCVGMDTSWVLLPGTGRRAQVNS